MSSRSSKKTSSDETVEVGRIARPHGVKGEALVESFSDVPERFTVGAELLAVVPGAPAEFPLRLRVETVRPHRGGGLLVRFAGIGDRERVGELRGAVLQVPRGSVPEPPEDTWYYFQLVGCRCRDRRHGELGEVVDVVEDGGGVLLVLDDGSRRLLVPFVRSLVLEVDPEAQRIELDLPEGLLEACVSRS
jgi:16S rRNA processing protein RimM